MGRNRFLIFILSLVIAFGTATAQKCNVGRLPMGPLLGPPGRDGLPGPAGPPGAPGSPGPSGVNLDELREIVRLMAKEELKNLTSEDREPVKVVVEYDRMCPTTDPTPSSPTNNTSTQQPTTCSPIASNPQNRSCAGLTSHDPAMSCHHILLCNPASPSGYYWIAFTNHSNLDNGVVRVYCHMEPDICGVSGLTRVAFLNMTDTRVNCPLPLILVIQSGKRMCVSPTSTSQFSTVEFATYNINYNYVCGRAIGYSKNQNRGFYYGSNSYRSIEQPYVSGLSVTCQIKGQRTHIWSFAAGYKESSSTSYNCPCARFPGFTPPSFVGYNYYCESGSHSSPSNQWYMDNPLWDGKGCYSTSRCCDSSRYPWFWTVLPDTTNSDIHVRWLAPQGHGTGIVGIEQLELYVTTPN